MDAPVEFRGGTGVTRDLSVNGVFFVCDTPMVVGSRLSVSILFDDNLADMPVRMDCKGTIVRIEQLSGKVGVAMRLDDAAPQAQTLH